MIRLTVIPRLRENLLRLLVAKELELRRKGRGTLHRSGPKKPGHEKWTRHDLPGLDQPAALCRRHARGYSAFKGGR